MVPQYKSSDNCFEARDRVATLMRDFYMMAQRTIDRRLVAHGTTLARVKLLSLIGSHESLRSTDIAAAFGHAPRTVTEAINGLERDGLIRRDPDPEDRRAKRISLTEPGRAALRESEPTRMAFVTELFGVLNEAERMQLEAVLDKLVRKLEGIDR